MSLIVTVLANFLAAVTCSKLPLKTNEALEQKTLLKLYTLPTNSTVDRTHHNTVGALNGSRDDATEYQRCSAAAASVDLNQFFVLHCSLMGSMGRPRHLARSACMGRYSTVGAIL